MDKSKLEELLTEIVRSGVGVDMSHHFVTPRKLIVSPTFLKAAEVILENNKAKSHEIEVKFDE